MKKLVKGIAKATFKRTYLGASVCLVVGGAKNIRDFVKETWYAA